MNTITATELKNHLGHYLHQAYREPIIVSKTGRPKIVILSYEDYQKICYNDQENDKHSAKNLDIQVLRQIKSLRDFANQVHINIPGFKFNRDEANER